MIPVTPELGHGTFARRRLTLTRGRRMNPALPSRPIRLLAWHVLRFTPLCSPNMLTAGGKACQPRPVPAVKFQWFRQRPAPRPMPIFGLWGCLGVATARFSGRRHVMLSVSSLAQTSTPARQLRMPRSSASNPPRLMLIRVVSPRTPPPLGCI